MSRIDFNIFHSKIFELFRIPVNVAEVRASGIAEIPAAGDPEKTINTIIETGRNLHITYLRKDVLVGHLHEFISANYFPFVTYFKSTNNAAASPVIIKAQPDGIHCFRYADGQSDLSESVITQSELEQNLFSFEKEGEVFYILVTAIPHEKYFSQISEEKEKRKKKSPVVKLIELINWERKDIGYVYLYATISGIIGLSLPLGVQSLVSFMQTGQVSTSVIVLISFVIIGVFLSGALQIMQLWIVETIQQRLFAKTAFEFSHKLLRVRLDYLKDYYPPELMNRFFDIVTLQKGLSGILLDFSSAILQILFGLILLSFYHPLFLIFGAIVTIFVYFVFRFTGEKGLDTSLRESKYKYLAANWLQQTGRSISNFQLSGYTNLPLEKTDYYVTNYLYARKAHFKVLTTQYWSFNAFKFIITGGLLILGTILLTKKEINIGQFVASEIVVILIINAIEKAVYKLDNVYDVLTSVEKISQIVELPVNTAKVVPAEFLNLEKGMHIKFSDFAVKDDNDVLCTPASFELMPGESVCISSVPIRKSRLIDIFNGSDKSYGGSISINNVNVKSISQEGLFHHISKILITETLFDGSVLDNITMGRSDISVTRVYEEFKRVGLLNYVNSLPDGIFTAIVGGNTNINDEVVRKMIYVRAFARPFSLLIVDDLLLGNSPEERIETFKKVLEKKADHVSIMVFSNDNKLKDLCNKFVNF